MIPKIIHQTFPEKDLPIEFENLINNLKSDNPDHEHTIFMKKISIYFIKVLELEDAPFKYK